MKKLFISCLIMTCGVFPQSLFAQVGPESTFDEIFKQEGEDFKQCAIMALGGSLCGAYFRKEYKIVDPTGAPLSMFHLAIEATSKSNASSQAREKCAEKIMSSGTPIDGVRMEDMCPGCPSGFTGCELGDYTPYRPPGYPSFDIHCSDVTVGGSFWPWSNKPRNYLCRCEAGSNGTFIVQGQCRTCESSDGTSCEQKLKVAIPSSSNQ